MDVAAINELFALMINQRGIHTRLGIDSQKVRNYRQNVKSGKTISLQLQIRLLRKADYLKAEPEKEYTRQDLVDLIKWYNEEKQIHEPDYAVHKWKLQRGQGIAEHVNNPAAALAKKIISIKQ